MLAAVRVVRELGEDADLHREKSSIAGVTGLFGSGLSVKAEGTVTQAKAAVQPADRECIPALAVAEMKPKAIAARLGLEAKAMAAELRRARAAGVPIPRFAAGRRPAAEVRDHNGEKRA